MEDNTQKIALTESLKAEEKKVLTKRPISTAKNRAPKPSRAKPAIVVKPVKTPKRPEKNNLKHKIVRDSFTIPENEYKVLDVLKKKCLAGGIAVKKSELLRAGLKSLEGMSLAVLKKQLSKLDEIKIGRPAKVSKQK